MALKFDGQKDYLETSPSLLNQLSAFTLEGWIKPASQPNTASLFGQNDVIQLGFSYLSKIGPKIGVFTNRGGGLEINYPYPTCEWHHVAIVGDGKGLAIYLDGSKKQVGGKNIDNQYGASRDPFQIGAGVWSGGSKHPFHGQMEEVRVWTCPRTASEIKADMQRQLTGNESGLLAYYRLEEDPTIDWTGNGHDCIIHGNPQIVRSSRNKP